MGRAGYGRWFGVSAVGLAVGVPAGLVLGAPLEVLVGAMVVTPLMLGLSGLVLGTSQWIDLRHRMDRAGRWIALTVLGAGSGLTIAVVTVEQGGAWLSGAPVRLATTGTLGLVAAMAVLGVLGGSVLGLTQSLALPARDGARRRWVAASTLGLSGGFLGGLICATAIGGVTTAPGLLAFLAVSGVVYAWVTGQALVTSRLDQHGGG